MTLVTACTFIYTPPDDEPFSKVRNVSWLFTKSCFLISYVCVSFSGVAKVPYALGQDIFLRPPSTKLTKFDLKYRCNSAEEAKAEHLL